MTHRFTHMRSDMGQGGDCCWAFATAVYSRTSERSGMRRLWDSLTPTHTHAHSLKFQNPWTRPELHTHTQSYCDLFYFIFFLGGKGVGVWGCSDKGVTLPPHLMSRVYGMINCTGKDIGPLTQLLVPLQ